MKKGSTSPGGGFPRFLVGQCRPKAASWLGLVLALSHSLPFFSFDSQAQTVVNICDRTDQVEAEILAKLPAGTMCAHVDSSQLANIKLISTSNKRISSLKAGDFSGLSSLESVNLDNNVLSDLPEELFDGLSSLKNVYLSNNVLSTLPEDLFDGLTKLEGLSLYDNSLKSLPEDLFDGLTNLEDVYLSNNVLSTLPEDLFDGLTKLEDLSLYDNSLKSLPEDLFDGLTNLEDLNLRDNSLESLPEDLFDGLTTLEDLWLHNNSLKSLPKGLFNGLTSLETLNMHDNSLESLPEDLFDGLTNLEDLWLYDNSLKSLPEGLFNGLTKLEVLGLQYNSLTNLPEDLFDGLTTLRSLYLDDNLLESLPEDLFDGLTSLGSLILSDNSLASLPENLFDHVKQSLTVWLENNPKLSCLPAAIVHHPTVTTRPRFSVCSDVTATLSLSRASISENGGSATVTATLDRASSSEVKIVVSTMPQAAVSPDFVLSSTTTLTIKPGTTTSAGTVTITAVDNDADAPDKTVTIQGTVTSAETVIGPSDVTLTITDDDASPTVTLVLTPVSISENGGHATVTATLDRPSSEVTTVIISAIPQSPALMADYTLSTNTTLTIAAGQTKSTGNVTIMAVDNDVDGPDKTVTIQGSAGNTHGVTDPADVTLTIVDDDMASVLAPASVAVAEGGFRDLSVALSLRPTGDVMVMVTGHASTDLTPNPTTLTFTPTTWSTPQPMRLTAAEDGDVTNDRATLTLIASGGGYAGVRHSVAVTIIDNDVAAIAAPASFVVPEGGSNGLPVALASPPTGTVTVRVGGYMGTDLMPTPSVLIYTTTNWTTAQTIIVTAEEDEDAMNDDKVLTFTASGGGYEDITHKTLVTITDNDVAAITAAASVTVPEGGSSTLPVALSAQPSAAVTLTIAGYAGTDLTPNPTTLTFTTTNWSTSQPVTLAAAEDEDFADDSVTMTFEASGGGYANVTHSVAVTITDNDAAAVTAPMAAMVLEGGSTNLPVVLSVPPTSEVMLTISGHAGTDLTPVPPVLIFTPSDWSAPQTVTLTAAEDGDFTDDPVMLTLTASGGGYTGVTHSVAVTITDNDVAAVTAPAFAVVPEGGIGDLSVALSSPPTAAVTLTIGGYPGTDLTPTPLTLTFTTVNWRTPQTVTLRAVEDDDFTDDAATLILTASGGGYTGVMHSVTVTITDNDTAAITAPASAAVLEGGTSDLSVALLAQPTATVTLTITGYAGTDLTPAPETLTFSPANWNVTQTITLTAAEDEDFADDAVTLTLAARGGGYTGVTHSVAVTITDNDTQAPLSLSIQDLQIVEDAAKAWLRIELNRPSQEVVTVQYATSDKTAEKGSDYTASRGIVVFDRNTTKGVIPVGILDDTIPEAEEQLMVTLSKPRNAVIERGVGTLTIVDNDGDVTLRIEDEVVEADAGMIRFTVQLSRPSSESVTVAYRTKDGTAKAGEDYRASSGVVEFAPGAVTAMIAVPLLLKNLDWQEETFSVHLERSTQARISKAVAMATIRKADSAVRDMLASFTARFVRTLSVQVVEALQNRFRSQVNGSSCGAGTRAELARLWHASSEWTPSLGELLAGCHISEGMVGGAVRVWGRGAFRQFHGQESLRGEVATGLAGVDYGWNGRWVAGVLLAHSRGEGSYAVQENSGELASRLTGVYPYVAYQSQERGIWGAGGYGWGRAEALELAGDLGSGFGTLGFWGRLGSTHPVQLTYYGDGIYADAVVTRQDVDTEVYRLRLGLEADMQIREGVRPYVKASVRQDGGSAETGLGLELGGGVRVAVPTWRLKADVQTQGLVVHTAEGFTEWGVSGSVQVGEQAQGLMLRVRPSWGTGMSLAHHQTVLDVVPAWRSLHRTEMELGYGVAMGQGTARSILGTTWQSGGALLRLGGELRPRDRFRLSAFGLVHTQATAPGELGLNIRGSLRF